MGNDRRKVRVAHRVEECAVGKRMRFCVQVVVIGDALGRRLRIVAANAMKIVDLEPQLFLVSQGNFRNPNLRMFPGAVRGPCDDLILARHGSDADVAGELSIRAGEPAAGMELHAAGSREVNQRACHGGAFGVVDLHHDRLIELAAGAGPLFVTAHDDNLSAECLGLGLAGPGSVPRARGRKGQQHHHPHSLHLRAASFRGAFFCAIRNAVIARASSSFMFHTGSSVPFRRLWAFFSQWKIQTALRRAPT